MKAKEYLKKIINEELSINEQVAVKSRELLYQIEDSIKNQKYISIAEGVKKCSFSVRDNFNQKPLLIVVYHYNFLNKAIYEKERYTINCDYAYSICDGKKTNQIIIHCFSISGLLWKRNLSDSIQHELEHIFQGQMGNSQLINFNSNYINASKNLLSDNKALKHVSNVLYYSYSFEQDGYVNGLYADLITNTSIIPSWDNIKDSSAYTGYAMLSKSLEIISKNKDKKSVIDSCNMYNITVNELLKNGYAAKERFIRKIGNVIIKARKDKQLNENINITTGKHGEITWFED